MYHVRRGLVTITPKRCLAFFISHILAIFATLMESSSSSRLQIQVRRSSKLQPSKEKTPALCSSSCKKVDHLVTSESLESVQGNGAPESSEMLCSSHSTIPSTLIDIDDVVPKVEAGE